MHVKIGRDSDTDKPIESGNASLIRAPGPSGSPLTTKWNNCLQNALSLAPDRAISQQLVHLLHSCGPALTPGSPRQRGGRLQVSVA